MVSKGPSFVPTGPILPVLQWVVVAKRCFCGKFEEGNRFLGKDFLGK